MRFSANIIDLLRAKSGCAIRVSGDCEVLVHDMESVTGEHVGVNTMKRLLGFIADEREPRTSTLDIIARYLGMECWDDLRLYDENAENSAFDERDEYLVCNLSIGQEIHITYLPNRRLSVVYLGDNHFRVTESENSKLLTGDELLLTHIIRHYPLLVADVIREGKSLGAFTAGKDKGVDFEFI